MIIIANTPTPVTANVSGPVADFMPVVLNEEFEVLFGVILLSRSDEGGLRVWRPGVANNSLQVLEAGAIYQIVTNATMDVPAVSGETDDSQAKTFTLLLRGNSSDGVAEALAGVNLPNNSVSIIKFLIAGKGNLDTYRTTKEAMASVSCSDTGFVTVNNLTAGYSDGDASAFTLATGTNRLIPTVQNTLGAFSGTTKWALKIEVVYVVYLLPL